VLGVCETDYSGYPDCRKATMDALSESIRLGNGLEEFCIATPLMYLSKAATVKMALELGPLAWEAVGLSVTCYQGHVPGCGKCPSCLLREKGFAEANAEDPALKRAVRNGIKWGTP
jgi:7-cyano-7-deazaguanine synthase